MVNDLIAVLLGNEMLTVLDFLIDKFDHLTGINVHHMIVMMV